MGSSTQIKGLLKLPTKWTAEGRSEEELQELELLGVDTEGEEYSTPGYIYVFINQIVGFNKSSTNQTTLRLSDGNAYKIYISVSEFINILKENQ